MGPAATQAGSPPLAATRGGLTNITRVARIRKVAGVLIDK
jgi:hypothetical protein